MEGEWSFPYDVTGHQMTTTKDPETGTGSEPLEEVLRRHLATTRFVVQNILNPAVVAFGLVGNSLNIAVLTRRWMKSSTNYYLTALALYDILYLALAFIMSATHYNLIGANQDYLRYRRLLVRPLTDTCSNTGVWITLTFTVERYIGVCHPMRGKVWCTPRRAKYIIGAVCLSVAIITAPEFFDSEAVEILETNTTVRMIDFGRTAFSLTRFYFVYSYAVQALFTFVPLLLLLIFNTLLIRQVMLAAKNRRQMAKKPDACAGDHHSRDQQKITVMLISVVIVFLLCQLPQSLQNLYEIYLDVTDGSKTEQTKLLLRITANVFNLLVMINGASNFILYSSFSTKFRLTFSRLFFCRCLTTNAHPPLGGCDGRGGGAGRGGSTGPDYYSYVISSRTKTPMTTTCSSKHTSCTLAKPQSYSTSISCTVHSWK